VCARVAGHMHAVHCPGIKAARRTEDQNIGQRRPNQLVGSVADIRRLKRAALIQHADGFLRLKQRAAKPSRGVQSADRWYLAADPVITRSVLRKGHIGRLHRALGKQLRRSGNKQRCVTVRWCFDSRCDQA